MGFGQNDAFGPQKPQILRKNTLQNGWGGLMGGKHSWVLLADDLVLPITERIILYNI